MRHLIRPASVVLSVLVAAACASSAPAAPPAQPVNANAAVLADFKKRIDGYLEIRGDVEKGAAEQKETSDPARIRAAQENLAQRIRTARAGAKGGEIFTPEIRAAFRRLMYPETTGAQGRQTKSAIEEDAPASVPLKVNSAYPEGAPLPTVPGNLLESLPQLPDALEYRIIDKHLLLRDVDANLIVDYIPNAIR